MFNEGGREGRGVAVKEYASMHNSTYVYVYNVMQNRGDQSLCEAVKSIPQKA